VLAAGVRQVPLNLCSFLRVRLTWGCWVVVMMVMVLGGGAFGG
jgi:hypothetical protein